MIRIKITKPNKVKIPLIIISAAAILFALLKPMSLDLKNAKTAITNDGTKKQIEYGATARHHLLLGGGEFRCTESQGEQSKLFWGMRCTMTGRQWIAAGNGWTT